MIAKRQSQKGITLVQVLLAVAVSGLLSAGALRASIGQKADADYATSIRMMTAEIPEYLVRFYYTNGNEYDGIMPNAKNVLVNQFGAPATMPWGDNWTVVNTDGTPAAAPTRLRMRFPCAQSTIGCAEMLRRVQAAVPNNPLITAAQTSAGNASIDVVYGTPR